MIKDKYPDLANEWYIGNFKKFTETNIEYPLPIKWHCEECKQVWETMLFDKLNGYKTCPYCSEKLPIPTKNSLKAHFPDVSSEWDYTRNTYLLNILVRQSRCSGVA